MLDQPTREALSAIAIVLTFVGFWPYGRSILKGDTKPHVFSWVIWSAVTLIVFFAQLAAKGGAGAWPTGVSGVITTGIAILAWMRRGELKITRMDWLQFSR
jgi:O-antigen/teichoic acid export membrane protein